MGSSWPVGTSRYSLIAFRVGHCQQAASFTILSPERTPLGCTLYLLLISHISEYKSLLEKIRPQRQDDMFQYLTVADW